MSNVYLNEEEITEAYELATNEATQWRKEYPEYERLADNGLLEDLDENLPEVNDGSLAASLFKLAKRVIKKKMAGQVIALDRDDAWLSELANIYWEKKILPNAKSKASPRRKWKDIARKAAIFGGQPVLTLMVNRGEYHGADFIAPYAMDVKLEAGKDSDMDSDIIFWDVYYSRFQLRQMIADAKDEQAEFKEDMKAWKQRKAQYEQAMADNEQLRGEFPDIEELPPFDEDAPEPFNEYNIAAMEKIAAMDPQDHRPGNEQSRGERQENGVVKTGYHLYVAFQRGVAAPFNLMDPTKASTSPDAWLRKWSNPDPTGDVPIHYLYCYQDFVNPYGIGIVKLAGGTQNVLDYMRKIHVLATQVGVSPPKLISGDEDDVDEESMVMARDANWYIGNTTVQPWNMANGVYQQIPDSMSMYQTSLQKIIPVGDTTISSTSSGDSNVGKTPQALQMAAASLSIDDEDFAENIDECYEAVAASMINTHFANMHADEILKLSDDERDRLEKAGIPFSVDEETGQVPNELEVIWDNCRANFQFEIDPDGDTTTDDKTKLDGLTTVLTMFENPAVMQFLATGQPIMLGTKSLDPGELVGEIISLTTDNDKILKDVTPEEKAMMQQPAIDPTTGQPMQQPGMMPQDQGQLPAGAPMPAQDNTMSPDEQAAGDQIAEIKELYNVDDQTAAAMLEAERQGYEPEEVLAALQRNQGAVNGQ